MTSSHSDDFKTVSQSQSLTARMGAGFSPGYTSQYSKWVLSGSLQGNLVGVHHGDVHSMSIKSRGTHPVTCQDHIAYKGLIWQLNVGPLGSESVMLTTVLHLS